jgi:hypothetical protein
MERSGLVAAAVRAVGYVSEDEDEDDQGSSVEEEDDDDDLYAPAAADFGSEEVNPPSYTHL